MKKQTYVQIGLLLLAVSLCFLQTREGFDQFSSPTCRGGKEPSNTARGPMCETASTPRACDPGYTAEGQGCRSADGTQYYSPPGCPDGFIEGGENCVKREPAECPPGTQLYNIFNLVPNVEEQSQGPKCVPNNTTTYEANMPPPATPPDAETLATICTPGDTLGFKPTPGIPPVCLSVRAKPPSTTQESSKKETSESKDAKVTAPNVSFVLTLVFLTVLIVVNYSIFPFDTANLVAFALLCLGIAMGFFLRR